MTEGTDPSSFKNSLSRHADPVTPLDRQKALSEFLLIRIKRIAPGIFQRLPHLPAADPPKGSFPYFLSYTLPVHKNRPAVFQKPVFIPLIFTEKRPVRPQSQLLQLFKQKRGLLQKRPQGTGQKL